MYVIEPGVHSIHIYWQDSSAKVQHMIHDGTTSGVDIRNFHGLAETNEVYLLIPTGLDILTGVQTPLDQHALSLLSECAQRLPEYNRISFEIACQLTSLFPDLHVTLICISAFYQSLPDRERFYAIDPRLFRSTYQRFGGDGLCHFGALKFIQNHLKSDQKVVSIHLCDQPSITAWQNDAVVYSSMGYSPLEGLISADGSGSIDPGIPLVLADAGHSPAEIRRTLVQDSGWNALLGSRKDINELHNQGSLNNTVPLDILLSQIIEHIGSASSALCGLNAIVFSVDSLQHSKSILSLVATKLAWLGYRSLSELVMQNDRLLLSSESSSILVLALEYSPLEIIAKYLRRSQINN